MKHYLKSLAVVLILTSLLVGSCQNEENNLTQNEGTLTKTSALSLKLQRLTMAETSFDNRIDSTDVFRIKLPFSMNVNGYPLTVAQEADWLPVLEILDESATNQDYVIFDFPITVIFADYSERAAANLEQYELYRLQGSLDNLPIGCMEVIYPIGVSVYEAGSGNATVVTINSDFEFFSFFLNLTANQFYSINYPISATIDGNIEIFNSNDSLLAAINAAEDNCECGNPEILTNDLVLYMPFGNEIADLTGFSAPTITGNYHFVTDRSGNPNGALSFDDDLNNGENALQTYQVPAGDILQNGNYSMSLWFSRQNPTPSNSTEVLVNSPIIFLQLGGIDALNGTWGPGLLGAGGGTIDPTWEAEGLNEELYIWHHIVVTYTSSTNTMSLYRDGTLRATYIPLGIPPSNLGFSFGSTYKGFLDDVRAYKRTLSPYEVETLYELEGDINQCMN
ncbi:MAG TPA: LamG domain-containing protein [Flavobacterium sp.]|nr:LamG domain-containing protein [Flavobacterium sp.]